MNRRWRPDPPGTIDPSKLTACSSSPPASPPLPLPLPLPPGALPTPDQPIRHQYASSPTTPSPTPHSPAAPPLARISSDWDSKHDIVSRGSSQYQAIRKQFETLHTEKGRSGAGRARHISHLGYFRRQTGIDADKNLDIPVDPEAPPGAKVLIDKTSCSIYDIYLLRADVSKNENENCFRRHQIVIHPDSDTYSLYTHSGNVGMKGFSRRIEKSTSMKSVVNKFQRRFREDTGLTWRRRYDTSCRPNRNHFTFAELDYTGTFVCPSIPDYGTMGSGVTDELKDLMELMLYGGRMRKHDVNEDSNKPKCCLPFSAPYKQLSAWSIFMGFKILEIIFKYLESARPFQWKAILTASSWYRSRIPFCAGHGRPPVISSYHALSLELRFLYSLHARREIALMLAKVSSRASLQLSTHKNLSQPLYQAYSSLRHGFRRLTDASTLEFRTLKEYLERSNHPTHHRKMELQEIYRVFIKRSLPNPYLDWIKSEQRDDAICGENRLLLWHGTPLDSLLGILDLGLQIRRRGANFTGTMFGNGIYLADVSSKSAGYCKSESWGGEAVILLCEADTGTYRQECLGSISNGHEVIEKSVGDRRCIQGMGRTRPAGWKQVGWDMGGLPYGGDETVLMPDTSKPYLENQPGGCLAFNEYVMYDPSHVLIRYIFRVKIGRKY